MAIRLLTTACRVHALREALNGNQRHSMAIRCTQWQSVAISLDLEGARSLELRVLPGKFGPIQDRVILSSALLLVGEGQSSRRESGER